MNDYTQFRLGNTTVSKDSIMKLQILIASLRQDLVVCVDEFYKGERTDADLEEFRDCWNLINYQIDLSKLKIKLIVKELKLRKIEVDADSYKIILK